MSPRKKVELLSLYTSQETKNLDSLQAWDFNDLYREGQNVYNVKINDHLT